MDWVAVPKALRARRVNRPADLAGVLVGDTLLAVAVRVNGGSARLQQLRSRMNMTRQHAVCVCARARVRGERERERENVLYF